MKVKNNFATLCTVLFRKLWCYIYSFSTTVQKQNRILKGTFLIRIVIHFWRSIKWKLVIALNLTREYQHPSNLPKKERNAYSAYISFKHCYVHRLIQEIHTISSNVNQPFIFLFTLLECIVASSLLKEYFVLKVADKFWRNLITDLGAGRMLIIRQVHVQLLYSDWQENSRTFESDETFRKAVSAH